MSLTTHRSRPEEQLQDLDQILALQEKAALICCQVQPLNDMLDELSAYQPFLISIALGDREDFSEQEQHEAMQMYMSLWLYFRDSKGAMSQQISQRQFEKFYRENIRYIAGNNFSDMRATVLWGVFFVTFAERPVLKNMSEQSKNDLMIGMKTLIDCFEEITK